MKETFEFQAEISQLMNLIINTFYSTKEIFLRELISNASDACDKLQFQALTNKEVLGEQKELRIDVIPNQESKTLVVKDTGIGMTKADLVSCLGTIARSGAKQFMEMIQEGSDVSLIGQFGVGFYSAYLVAERVEVISKNNDDECYKWSSTAGGTYEIEEVTDRPDMIRGTEIVLYLKEDQLEYLKQERLEELIKKHSMFIGYPIYLHKTVEKEVEVKAEEEHKEEVKPEDKPEEEGKVEEEKPEEKKPEEHVEKKKVTEQVVEHINSKAAIWTRDPKDVTEEEYKEFYKQINPTDWEGYLSVSHFRVDGAAQFRGILFIPKRAPFDLWETQKKTTGIKLMVKKVFITDECTDIVPEWLGFLKGVVDCDDLPLNISREMLQKNRIVNTIRKNLIKKALKLFKDLEEDKEKYETFLKNFGKNIKLGIHEDNENRDKLCKLLRFHTTKSGDKTTSFDDYITRMAEGQKNIYYITGDNPQAMKESPFLERFQKKNLEVIFFEDAIDEYMVSSLREVEGKQLKCITKEGVEIEQTEEEKKAFEEKKAKFEKLAKFMKDTLGDKVENVKVSDDRLVLSPCILVTSEWGWSANMQKIMKHQALRDDSMTSVMQGKKTMEINPDNSIIKALAQKIENEAEAVYAKDITTLLYETAMIQSGFDVEDVTNFSKRIFGMVKVGLGAEDEPAPAEEVKPVPDAEKLEDNADIDDVD